MEASMFKQQLSSTNLFLIIIMALTASSCTSISDKQYQLSQKSMKSGDYHSAFEYAARSLNAEINNEKTQLIFPQITYEALQYHFNEINQLEHSEAWGGAVLHYQQIDSIRGSIQAIQQALNTYAASQKNLKEQDNNRIQAILKLTVPDTKNAHYQARIHAAQKHYTQALNLAQAGKYRQAVAEFNLIEQYIRNYKDTLNLSIHYEQLADQDDAMMYYQAGTQAAKRGAYRDAAQAFTHALSYVSNFRDAYELSVRYRHLADKQDAEKHYQLGLSAAQRGQYRDAAKQLQRADSFIAGYKDTRNLYHHYTQLANEQDASLHYSLALNKVNQGRFAEAAREFRAANHFIPGFRDAISQAQWAEYFIPPSYYQVKKLIIHEINEYGVQPQWFSGYQYKRFMSTQLNALTQINRGRFNSQRRGWNYQVSMQISAVILDDDSDESYAISTQAYESFFLYRNRSGAWEAEFRHH